MFLSRFFKTVNSCFICLTDPANFVFRIANVRVKSDEKTGCGRRREFKTKVFFIHPFRSTFCVPNFPSSGSPVINTDSTISFKTFGEIFTVKVHVFSELRLALFVLICWKGKFFIYLGIKCDLLCRGTASKYVENMFAL